MYCKQSFRGLVLIGSFRPACVEKVENLKRPNFVQNPFLSKVRSNFSVRGNVRLCNEGSDVYYAPSYRSVNILIAFLRKSANVISNYPLTPPYLLPQKF